MHSILSLSSHVKRAKSLPSPHTQVSKPSCSKRQATSIAFPRRRSTWVILAIAGGAAAAVHPADESVNAHLAGSDAAGNFFAAGKSMAAYIQTGVAVGRARYRALLRSTRT